MGYCGLNAAPPAPPPGTPLVPARQVLCVLKDRKDPRLGRTCKMTLYPPAGSKFM